MFDTVISQGILLSGHNRYCPVTGSIGITNGRIGYAGPKRLLPSDGREYIDAEGHILMPGLTNGHCHGDMGFAKGFADNTTLEWQMRLFEKNNWFYDCITDEDRYYSRLHTYAESLLSGVTFLLENMFWSLGELSQQAFLKIGLRGALAEDIRDDFYLSDAFVSDEKLTEFINRCRGANLTAMLGTLPEEAFTPERLSAVKKITQKNDCFFTSHLAETAWRLEAAQRLGDSPVRLLDRYKLVNNRYIGSHACYLDDADIDLLAKRGAKVVNTPLCEMKLADGIAPIPALIRAGVTVALGTDGAMWNNSNDLFREMKCMALLHSLNSGVKSLTAHDVLDMATLNGAKLFGLDNELGSLEEGKLADLILIDATAPHMTPIRTGERENVSSCVVYCATGRDVTDVFVGGNQLVQNRRLLGINLKEIQKATLETSIKAAQFCPF
jgi:5-methylthioadenosine/S-adenosylhomocysteine deaminase